MNIKSSKSWLRSYLLNKRRQLTKAQRQNKGKFIINELLHSSHYKKARTIAVYFSFGSEVDTHRLIRHAFEDQKTVLLPVTKKGFKNTTFHQIFPDTLFERTKIGTVEPINIGRPFPFGHIDLIVVPGLGFDSFQNRIGFGGGTYDRLLKKASQAFCVGLFYSEQYVVALPVETHDRPLNLIISK